MKKTQIVLYYGEDGMVEAVYMEDCSNCQYLPGATNPKTVKSRSPWPIKLACLNHPKPKRRKPKEQRQEEEARLQLRMELPTK